MPVLGYLAGNPTLDLADEIATGLGAVIVPMERHNVNDYRMRSDRLVGLMQGYFNVNIADSPSMMITEKEAAALVDLLVAEL